MRQQERWRGSQDFALVKRMRFCLAVGFKESVLGLSLFGSSRGLLHYSELILLLVKHLYLSPRKRFLKPSAGVEVLFEELLWQRDIVDCN